MTILLFIVLCLCFKTYFAFTQCSSGTIIGYHSGTATYASTDTSGVGYLLEDETYQVKCCGYISQWKLEAEAAGTIVLQIWRKVGPNSYQLVGKNTETVAAMGTHTSTIALADRITVQHGDFIGWYCTKNLIKHEGTDNSYPVMNWFSTSNTDLDVGSIFDWTTGNVKKRFRFAVQATIVASTVPTFSFGATEALSIPDTTPADDNVLQLTVIDDGGDTIVYSTYANDNPYFYVDTINGQVKTSQANIPEGTYTITPMVTDDCYKTATTVVTITVQNVDLTFDGFSETSASIREDEYLEQNLTNVLVTEPNDGYYCYFISDRTYPFVVRPISSLYPEYAIYLHDLPQLNHNSRSSYSLVVECKEASGTSPVSASGTFTVNILQNTNPTMSSASASIAIDAKTTWTGYRVYTVVATDPENDPLTMTLTSSPANGPFDITDDGKIILTSNIMNHDTTSAYTLTIGVSDQYTETADTMTVSITINNINNAPVISNADLTASITENDVLGKSIYQVSVTDADTDDVIEYYAQFDPACRQKMFTLNTTTGEVLTSTTTNIDYDVISDTTIEMHVTVSDGKHLDTKTVTVTIINENEPPVISQAYFRIERDEGSVGQVFPNIPYEVDDPDVISASDVLTFSKNCGPEDAYVTIDPTTGQFSFAVNYDLDDASFPTDFTCNVTVTDAGSLSDTCIVDVHVDYINEFTPTFTSASYAATVLYIEFVGAIVVTANATDGDLGDHGKFYYELTNTQGLFGVMQNGSIFLNADLEPYFPDGHTLVMTLKAEDTGGLSSQVLVTITIPATDLVNTTIIPWKFWQTQTNNIIYELSCFVALACFCVIVYFCVQCCRKRPIMIEHVEEVLTDQESIEEEDVEIIQTQNIETGQTEYKKVAVSKYQPAENFSHETTENLQTEQQSPPPEYSSPNQMWKAGWNV